MTCSQAVLLIEKQVRMFLQRTRYKKLLRIAVTSALAIIQVPSLNKPVKKQTVHAR